MPKKLNINIITILSVIFLYTGFFLQLDIIGETLSRTNNSIVGLLMVVLMLITILNTKDNNIKRRRRPIVEPYVILWIIVLIIQTLITSFSLQRAIINFYYVTIWPIVYLFYYKISSNGLYKDEVLSKRLTCIIIAAAILYSVTAYSLFIIIGFNGSLGNSYYLLCILPFALIITKKIVRYSLVFVLVSLILISMKRTPIIALAVISIVYTASEDMNTNIVSKFFKVCIVAVIGIVMIYFIDQSLLDGHMMERFDNFERGADTRSEIRESVMTMYSKSPLERKIIGHGYNTVVDTNIEEFSAHNDYIETLYDHGLIVFILQIIIILRLFILSYKLYKQKSIYFAPLFSSVLMYIIIAFATHMILYPYYFWMITGFWGYIEGKYVSKRT